MVAPAPTVAPCWKKSLRLTEPGLFVGICFVTFPREFSHCARHSPRSTIFSLPTSILSSSTPIATHPASLPRDISERWYRSKKSVGCPLPHDGRYIQVPALRERLVWCRKGRATYDDLCLRRLSLADQEAPKSWIVARVYRCVPCTGPASGARTFRNAVERQRGSVAAGSQRMLTDRSAQKDGWS